MLAQQKVDFQEAVVQKIRLKLTERDCPRCQAILIHNNNEQCHECLNCGYIDCGDEDES